MCVCVCLCATMGIAQSGLGKVTLYDATDDKLINLNDDVFEEVCTHTRTPPRTHSLSLRSLHLSLFSLLISLSLSVSLTQKHTHTRTPAHSGQILSRLQICATH